MKKFILLLFSVVSLSLNSMTIHYYVDGTNINTNVMSISCNVGDTISYEIVNATSSQLFQLYMPAHGTTIASTPGNYTFTVQVNSSDINNTWNIRDINNGYLKISEGIIVQTTTGVQELSKMNVSIYPNPTSDYINIDLDEPVKNVSLYDINGKMVLNESDTKQLNVSNLNRGTYTLMVNTAKNSAAKTVILQ